jgi:hypothetical protein
MHAIELLLKICQYYFVIGLGAGAVGIVFPAAFSTLTD